MKDEKILEQSFSCKRGNLTLRGVVYRRDLMNQKIAVLMHGFMGTMQDQKKYALMLAEMGYACFTFDFAGGSPKSKSDGKFSEMTVSSEVKDCLAVLDFARKEPYTNKGPVLLLGCSQGGVVAALTAGKLKDKVEDLVLLYPAFVCADDARRGSNLFFQFDPQNIPDLIPSSKMPMLKLGGCYIRDLIDRDLYEEIAPYTGNVLILHGTADEVVPLSYSQRALETYQNSGAKVRLVPVIDGKHGFNEEQDKLVHLQLKSMLA